jgi:hypothetical protein
MGGNTAVNPPRSLVLPLPVFFHPTPKTVISTEDARGLIVSIAAEKSASLAQPFPTSSHCRCFAFVLVFAVGISAGPKKPRQAKLRYTGSLHASSHKPDD